MNLYSFISLFYMLLYVSLSDLYDAYMLAKGKIYNKLSMGIVTMVLKRLKFTCPTNRKTDACMRKEKFQNRD